ERSQGGNAGQNGGRTRDPSHGRDRDSLPASGIKRERDDGPASGTPAARKVVDLSKTSGEEGDVSPALASLSRKADNLARHLCPAKVADAPRKVDTGGAKADASRKVVDLSKGDKPEKDKDPKGEKARSKTPSGGARGNSKSPAPSRGKSPAPQGAAARKTPAYPLFYMASKVNLPKVNFLEDERPEKDKDPKGGEKGRSKSLGGSALGRAKSKSPAPSRGKSPAPSRGKSPAPVGGLSTSGQDLPAEDKTKLTLEKLALDKTDKTPVVVKTEKTGGDKPGDRPVEKTVEFSPSQARGDDPSSGPASEAESAGEEKPPLAEEDHDDINVHPTP
ncbi:hypothetical protein T484DRAFT_1807172, partial [Baffinella frigidus]